MMELSVVIPCYKEAENLDILLPELHRVCGALAKRYEIVVVDTKEPMDQTKDVCERHRVKYVNREEGDRYGDAIRTCIRQGTGEFLVIMDADNSHSPDFIEQMYRHRHDADVVIASRYIEGGHTEVDSHLTFMSLALNKIYSVVLGIDAKDKSNSFRLYRNEMLQKLVLRCNNFDILEEILYKLKCNNASLKILEIPYRFKKRKYGTTKRTYLSFIPSFFMTLIRLRASKNRY